MQMALEPHRFFVHRYPVGEDGSFRHQPRFVDVLVLQYLGKPLIQPVVVFLPQLGSFFLHLGEKRLDPVQLI